MYSYSLDGVTYPDPLIGIESFILTLERTGDDENIFREFAESTLTFTGIAAEYLCKKLAENYCNQVAFILNFDNEQIFEGIVNVSFGTSNYTKKTFETQVIDGSYRGLLSERLKNEVRLDSVLTISCQELTPIPIFNKQFFGFDSFPLAGTRPLFNVHDVFEFLIKYISDNTVDFVSDYFTTNKWYITTGWNLQANFIQPYDKRFPTISFQFLYTELRKLFALYSSIDLVAGVPTVRIEPEVYWFANTDSGYSIPDIPYDTTFAIDEERIYSIAKVGSTVTDPESSFNYFDSGRLNGWSERVYNSCGCAVCLN